MLTTFGNAAPVLTNAHADWTAHKLIVSTALPFAPFIPCHRATASNRTIGGFRGGKPKPCSRTIQRYPAAIGSRPPSWHVTLAKPTEVNSRRRKRPTSVHWPAPCPLRPPTTPNQGRHHRILQRSLTMKWTPGNAHTRLVPNKPQAIGEDHGQAGTGYSSGCEQLGTVLLTTCCHLYPSYGGR